jgi:hypothetical protein
MSRPRQAARVTTGSIRMTLSIGFLRLRSKPEFKMSTFEQTRLEVSAHGG